MDQVRQRIPATAACVTRSWSFAFPRRRAPVHDQAINFVRHHVQSLGLDKAKVRVLDIGGRKTSTSRYYSGPQPYELFMNAEVYHILDITPGPDVDIVADATQTLHIAGDYDVIVCT